MMSVYERSYCMVLRLIQLYRLDSHPYTASSSLHRYCDPHKPWESSINRIRDLEEEEVDNTS
jgi:hypothetical protein